MIRILLLASALTGPARPAAAGDGDGGPVLPPSFELLQLADTFASPIDLEFAGDGTLFVAQKRGQIFAVVDGVKQWPAALDLTDEVLDHGDRGMLAIALHPSWIADGGPSSWIYSLYTVSPVPGTDPAYNENDQFAFSRLSRWRVDEVAGELVIDPASREILIGHQLPDGSVPDGFASVHESHSSGTLVFAPDGSLLISAGDGAHFDFDDTGGFDDPAFDDWIHPVTGLRGPTPKEQDSGAFRAQDLRSLSGKVLRVDPETGDGYPSNPFFDGDPSSLASKVWALGLRNPFRMSLLDGTAGSSDPADGQPGWLLIGDVGWNEWEDLELCKGGENFGWPCYEGVLQQPAYQGYAAPTPNPFGYPDCTTPIAGVLTPPLLTVSHILASSYQPPGVLTSESGDPLSGFIARCLIGGPTYTGSSYPAQYLGRTFFVDYDQGWLYTLGIDPQGALVNVHPFGFALGDIVDVAAHPLTGDLWFANLDADGPDPVSRLRFGTNLTPIAAFTAAPTFGDAPLVVDFDGTLSFEPDGDALSYDWDFGDGTSSTQPTPQKTYFQNGVYTATLTVSDPFGLESSASQPIAVGNTPPLAGIASPAQCQLFGDSETMVYSGGASDIQDPEPALAWTVDQYHDGHVHPDFQQSSGASGSFEIEPHGVAGDVVYYRVTLAATDTGGLSGSDHRFVLPADAAFDATGAGELNAKVLLLDPAGPLGASNSDIEVIRDGVFADPLTAGPLDQYDSFHNGDQGIEDWIGVGLPAPPELEFRFFGLTFQEGLHNADGGWWRTIDVEVRDEQGAWQSVANLHVDPPYPTGLGSAPFFDGQPFETYELRFDPIWGDAIRMVGAPGGSANYISVAELRAHAIDVLPEKGEIDVTADGNIVARLFELTPPIPLGLGNSDPETIRNGTTPPTTSESDFAQFDTFHNGDQGDLDWIGYSLSPPRELTRVVFQEGKNFPGGGWFDTLDVEVRLHPGGSWTPVTNLQIAPAYPGTLLWVHYESFELSFDPVVAYGVRIVGDPGGADGFISVGELRVFALPRDCNANELEDGAEILAGLAPDLDLNGSPDECDPLSADFDSVSMSAFETQTLTLNAPQHAGALYLLGGSLSGTLPGIDIDGVHIPLNVDFYALQTLASPNQPPLSNSLGLLDAQGMATAGFQVPTPSVALLGATALHAYVVLDAQLNVVFASNAVPVRMQP